MSRHRQPLFEVPYILHQLGPVLAQSLLDSQDELAAAALRFPISLDLIEKESAALAERQNKSGGK
jgi:hypothetical protein